MGDETIQEMVDAALLNGMVEAECRQCGMSVQCEADANAAWCGFCEKMVKVKNPLIDLGLR